ncbi:MAG: hypothetical protein V1818_03995 [Candidatus Aenigmatarchaeota archaeon]
MSELMPQDTTLFQITLKNYAKNMLEGARDAFVIYGSENKNNPYKSFINFYRSLI